MSREVISDEGEDVVVREDTAKGFRWNKFIGIILAGIILILIAVILIFSGILSTTRPNLSPGNTANQNANAGR
ncbi:MAG: hypothetical protein ACJ72Z_10540 [Pyrinomonadaceae bacterium]